MGTTSAFTETASTKRVCAVICGTHQIKSYPVLSIYLSTNEYQWLI